MVQMLRAMGPQWIAVDEITSVSDCKVMEQCGNCGVSFLATAHAFGIKELQRRPVYRALLETKLFSAAAVLAPDRTYRIERLTT